jgi:hypothetical protein
MTTLDLNRKSYVDIDVDALKSPSTIYNSPPKTRISSINSPYSATRRKSAKKLALRCPDTSVCMAIGTESEKIKQKFNGFVHFKNAVKIERIGAESVNGFVSVITYNKIIKANMTKRFRLFRKKSVDKDYLAYAILKSSQGPTIDRGIKLHPDNLFYEYIVGQYLNEQNKRFPCFLETYGYYNYEDDETWNAMQSNKKPVELLKNLRLILGSNTDTNTDFDYAFACANPTHLAILVQYFKKPMSLKDYIDSNNNLDLVELTYILFQIYYTLAALSENFTHYDLHYNNVLLYEPENGKYIEYHYHYKNENGIDEVITFKSKYMVKIIDYGRCYFNFSESLNSETVHKELCQVNECEPECGWRQGFHYYKNNNNIDLLILAIVYDEIQSDYYKIKFGHYTYYKKMINNLLEKVKWHDIYKIKIQKPPNNLPDDINNVNEAFNELVKLIRWKEEGTPYRTVVNKKTMKTVKPVKTYCEQRNETRYEDMEKMGDLHVYNDGREMEYISAYATI